VADIDATLAAIGLRYAVDALRVMHLQT